MNYGARNFTRLCNFPNRTAFGKQLSYLYNLLRCCVGSIMVHAFRLIATLFRFFVAVVIQRCTEKQMKRANARRIIASVANKQSFRVLSIIKKISESVGKKTCVITRESAIPVSVFTFLPFPASIVRNNNVRPIPFNVFLVDWHFSKYAYLCIESVVGFSRFLSLGMDTRFTVETQSVSNCLVFVELCKRFLLLTTKTDFGYNLNSHFDFTPMKLILIRLGECLRTRSSCFYFST